MDRHRLAVRSLDQGAHRLGIFGAEIEDVADLDAAGRDALVLRNRLISLGVVHFRRRRIERRPFGDGRLQAFDIVEIGVGAGHREIQIVAMTEHFGFAGVGEDDEFVAEIAADRPGIGLHGNRFQAEPREGAQIGYEHLVVGMDRALLVEIEGIGILHQEFARTHDAEARAHLVAELPLDVVEVERQVLVGLGIGAEDLGDHFLVGRPEQHFAVLPVADAQHFLAIGVIASAFAPEVGRLHGRHQELDRPRAILLLPHDARNLLQHAITQRQPGIDAGAFLAHHAGAQHQPVRHDLGFLRRLAQDRQEIAGQAHRKPLKTGRRWRRRDGTAQPGIAWCRPAMKGSRT